ncbi:MAG: sugar phosphate isomerase/epimerase [Treponema sp.]|jgi:hexulose-6-phosphate isomerase|nr:sugar phosphate isomerase/epimerase [Treponema sp.]
MMMKKSINAWTIDAADDFEAMFKAVKEAGFQGIELNVDKDGSSAHSITLETGTDLEALTELSRTYSLPVVSISTSLGGTTGLADRENRRRAHKVIRRQIECAKVLNAGAILSVPGGVSGDLSLREARDNSLECYRELGDEIAASGVQVCLEQVWNGFFTSPFDMARFIDELDNPLIGAYFDVGNVLAFSWPEYWIEVLGQRIRRVHVKDFKRSGGLFQGGNWVDLGTGDADWCKVLPALRKAGFDGYLTAETSIGESAVPGITYPAYYKTVSEALERIIGPEPGLRPKDNAAC